MLVISEPGGYFDTENLVSNETGYLKAKPTATFLVSYQLYLAQGD